MGHWSDDNPQKAPANPAAPRLRKAGRPRGTRIPVPIRICPILHGRFEELVHTMSKMGRKRPELYEEAIQDILKKYTNSDLAAS